MTNKIQNYRVTFSSQDKDSIKLLPLVQEVFSYLDEWGITDYWYFFEPYIEITWIDWRLDENSRTSILNNITSLLERRNAKNIKIFTPNDGNFVGWYNESPKELEFEWKSHVLSRKMADLFFSYKSAIENGKGLDQQLARRFHLLANQCGYNYKRESNLLIKRGILCKILRVFGYKWGIRIWKYLLFQKY